MSESLRANDEQLRELVVKAISDAPEGQLNTLRFSVYKLAVDAGLVHRTPNNPAMGIPIESPSQKLDDRAFSRLCDIVWDLIIERKVYPGSRDGSTFQLPHYHVPLSLQ